MALRKLQGRLKTVVQDTNQRKLALLPLAERLFSVSQHMKAMEAQDAALEKTWRKRQDEALAEAGLATTVANRLSKRPKKAKTGTEQDLLVALQAYEAKRRELGSTQALNGFQIDAAASAGFPRALVHLYPRVEGCNWYLADPKYSGVPLPKPGRSVGHCV